MAEALEKAGATLQDELDYSYFTGKTEGKAEGILDVIKMLKQGKSIDEIMRDTGVSLAEA